MTLLSLLALVGCSRPSPAPPAAAPAPAPPAAPSPEAASSAVPPASPEAPAAHSQPLVAFAVSPDGALLATGACASWDHADDPVDGVVLWDVATGARVRRIDVPGGVGLPDQLRGGIQFSGDGGLLGINGHTNGVFTARVATGERLADIYATGNDGAPQFAFSADGATVVVGDGGAGPRGLLFPTVGTVKEGRPLAAHGGTPLTVVRYDASGVLVVEAGALRRYPADGGAPVELARLPVSEVRATAVRGSLLAVGGRGLALYDLDRGAPIGASAAPEVEDLVFAARSDRLLVIEQRHGQKPARAVIVDGGAPPVAIDRLLSRIDWLRFPDALPAALSPDGKEALLVGTDGAIERWTLDPPVLREVLARRTDVLGVAWPRPDRAVLLGPQVLVFVALPEGRVLHEERFPAAE